MGYTVYWLGELAISPPLATADVVMLEHWLKLNSHEPIEDERLDQLMQKDGHDLYIGNVFSMVDTLSADEITYSDEGRWPSIEAIVLYRMVELIKEMGSTVSGELFWTGDESEDIGHIVVKQGALDTEVWVCDASIVYSEPGSEDSRMISDD